MFWRMIRRRSSLASLPEMGFKREGFWVMPAKTVHSDRVRSDTSLLKYRFAATLTPRVLFPRLMVFK